MIQIIIMKIQKTRKYLAFEIRPSYYFFEIFTLRIRLKKLIYRYMFRHIYIDYKIRQQRRHLNYDYKIIPIGAYCIPRVITTISKLKPSKKQGEKTCPFDLAFFSSMDKITELISNKFADFYDGLIYDNEKKQWVNNRIQATFIHDGKLSENKFKERYNSRIKNMYDYLCDINKHTYLFFASFRQVSSEQIRNLVEAISKYRAKNTFDIIILNQSREQIFSDIKNVHVINQSHNADKFAYINNLNDWAGELRRRVTRESQDIYYEIISELITILSKNNANC